MCLSSNVSFIVSFIEAHKIAGVSVFNVDGVKLFGNFYADKQQY